MKLEKIRVPELHDLKLKQRYIRFFYTTCQCCKNEYKHTVMWRYKSDVFDPDIINEYLCMGCCPSVDQAYRQILGDDGYNNIFETGKPMEKSKIEYEFW